MNKILFALFMSLSLSCNAQFYDIVPDCCSQAIKLQAKVIELQYRLDTTSAKRDTLKAVGTRLLKEKDRRIKELESKGTEQIRQGNSLLATVESELEAELIKSRFMGWGRRKFIGKLLKTVRNK